MPVTAQHAVVRWNRQAAGELSFGVPEGWLDVDLGMAQPDARGAQPIAGVRLALPEEGHRVLVYRGDPVGDHESTYVLANLARLAAELEQGCLVGSPVPLLVAGERAFLARYTKPLAAFTEAWVASGGLAYRLVLSGPASDHEACLPFLLTMLATLRWARTA